MTTLDLGVPPARDRTALRARKPALTRAAARAGGAAGVGAALTLVHGMTPWGISSLTSWYTTVAAIRCGALSVRDLLADTCAVVGGPSGAEVGNGRPFVLAGTALVRITGVSAEWAFALVALVLMSLGALGVLRLASSYGVRTSIGLVAAAAYLASPSLVGMQSFGGTFWGMVVLPLAVWVAVRLARLLDWRRPLRSAGVVLTWTVASYVLLALDGYAFVMAQAATGLLLVADLIRDRARVAWAERLGGLAVADALAYLAYRRGGSGGEGAASSIDLFRAMGADLVTLVQPSGAQWWARAWGLTADHSLLWGDGSNATFNYAGLFAVALAAVGAVLAVRRRAPVAIWLVVGAAALLMALGPSLKVDEVRGPLVPPVTYESYLMPESDAVVTLPTQWLYEAVPGLDMMRATYRWYVVTRLAVVVLGAFAVERLVRRGGWRAVVAVTAGALAVIELAPDVVSTWRTARANVAVVRDFDATVVDPLDEALPDGSTVLLSPNSSGANDFLASYIATGSELALYNVGGDKALAEARTTWPPHVAVLLSGTTRLEPEDAVAVLTDGTVSAVVVPLFDLRWSVTAWPPAAQFAAPGRGAVEDLEADPRFEVEEHDRFAVVTLAPGG